MKMFLINIIVILWSLLCLSRTLLGLPILGVSSEGCAKLTFSSVFNISDIRERCVFEINSTNNTNTLLGTYFSPCNLSHGDLSLHVKEKCVLKINNKTYHSQNSNIILKNITFHSGHIKSCQCFNTKNVTDWVGVIFSIYDKYPENGEHVSWWNYSKDEIKNQLNLVSTEFRQISMYGIGTVATNAEGTEFNTNWRDGLPIAQTALTLAEINKGAGYLKLTGILGAFSLPAYPKKHLEAEVFAAIAATRYANSLFPKSISGISLHFDINFDAIHNDEYIANTVESLKTINNANYSAKAGLRFTNCEQAFVMLNRTEDAGKLYCKPTDSCTNLRLYPQLENLVRNANFVICFLRPQTKKSWKNSTMSDVVESVGSTLEDIRRTLRNANSKIEVMLETGWPSRGLTVNGSPNTLKNMRDYWLEISNWAMEKKIRVFMFESFDEPWKMDLRLNGNRTETDSICGSEGYYGWWKRVDNQSPNYFEKVKDVSETDSNVTSIESSTLPDTCEINDDPSLSIPNKWKSNMIISVASTIFLIMALVVVILIFRLKTAKKSQSRFTQRYLDMFRKGIDPEAKNSDNSDDYQIIALRFPYDKQKYELESSSFKIDMKKNIGRGQGGTVYKGKINCNPDPIAFKTTDSSSSILDIKNLLSEIKILSYIGQHQNIICIIGAYTEKLEKGIVYLGLEYCPLGSLEKFLQGNGKFVQKGVSEQVENLHYVTTSCFDSSTSITDTEDEEPVTSASFEFDINLMLQWTYEITNGMEFLSSKKVVHCDLATRNYLLTSTKSIKITDFGLSQKLYTEINPNLVFDSDVRLPWRWMSPESLRKLVFSPASDIWSFGISVWEIFTLGKIPYTGLTFCNQFITELEEGTTRLEDPDYATEDILDILDMCWSSNPEDRPDFTNLKAKLEHIISKTC